MDTPRGLLCFRIYVKAYGHWLLLEEVWATTFDRALRRFHSATREWYFEALARGESRVESGA